MPDGPVINYATADERRGRPVAAVFVGIVAVGVGIFGAAWVAIAIIGAIGGFLYGGMRESPASYVALNLIAMIVGVVCLYVAIRCWRAARRFLSP